MGYLSVCQMQTPKQLKSKASEDTNDNQPIKREIERQGKATLSC